MLGHGAGATAKNNALIEQIRIMKLKLEIKHGPEIKKKWQKRKRSTEWNL